MGKNAEVVIELKHFFFFITVINRVLGICALEENNVKSNHSNAYIIRKKNHGEWILSYSAIDSLKLKALFKDFFFLLERY